MQEPVTLLRKLHYFVGKLESLIDKHNQDQMVGYYSELEEAIDDYSSFITNSENENQWQYLEQTFEISLLIEKLRKMSADCVKIMEKHWALKYLHENEEMTDYFRNIEGCIEKELSGFHITNKSKVLVIGSGPFPITSLSIAKRTGAKVLGIDIDDEAILLGRQVAAKLGNHTIQIENKSVNELQSIQQISHIIFSSTVNCKYDILEQLHELTNKDVMIAMRYGNALKSLFNYPMETVDATKWHIVEQIAVPKGVFDIALYQKV